MITIVDYGMGNLGSIANMLKKLGVTSCFSSEPQELLQATKLILPGVGAFDHGMAQLKSRNLIEVLNQRVQQDRVPVLGICLGMQLLARSSEEGELPGLGWLDATVQRIVPPAEHKHLRVPHMGWCEVAPQPQSKLLAPAGQFQKYYFVHSYHMVCERPEDVWGTAEYGMPITAAVGHGQVMGVQFHPEKSHRHGMALLRAFAEI